MMPRPLRVLIIEDNEADAALMLRELQHGGYEPVARRAESADVLQQALQEESWDVVLMDWTLPQFNALSALDLVKSQDLDLPCIIVSGTIGEEAAASGIKAGAHNFVSKENLKRLVLTVEKELREADYRRAHRQTDAALLASEERYARAAAVGKVGVWEFDVAKRLYHGDANMKALLGYGPDELSTDPSVWLNLVHPDDRPAAMASGERIVTGTTDTYHDEFRLVRKDGTIIWLELRGRAVRDAEGHLAYLLGATVDITEHKRAEEALLQRSCQQQVVARFGQFALREHGLQMVMDEAVHRVAQTLEVDYCKVLELRPDGTALLLKAGVGWHDGLVGQATVGAGADSQAGYTLGSSEPVILEDLRTEQRFSAPPLLLDHGIVSGLSVIIQGEQRPWGILGAHMTTKRTFTWDDVSFVQAMANVLGSIIERNSVEKALQESERQLRMSLEASKAGTWSWDVGSNTWMWDERYHELYGFESHHPISFETWIAGVHPDDRLRLQARIQILLESGSGDVWDQEFRVLHPVKGMRWMQGLGHVERNEAGRAIRFAGINLDITRRKEVEEQLALSEERLRLALVAANQGLYDIDLRRGVVAVSDEYARMLGYEPATFQETNARWAERLHPDDRARVCSMYEAYLRGEIPNYEVEYRQRTNSGDWKWILSVGSIVSHDPEGRPLRMLGIHTDITERRQAQEKRYHSEAQLQAILDNSPSLIFLKDRDGRYLKVNREFERVFDRTSEEIVGRTDREVFSPEQAALFHMNDEKVLEGGMPLLFEEVASYGDETHVAIVHKFPLRDKEGALYAIGGIATDITERKQAEEALRASEERFDLAVRGSNTGIWDWDLRTNKTYFSPLWKSMLGYEEHELKGEFFEWEKRLHPDDRDRSSATVRAYLDGTTPQYELEHRLRHKDGSYRWILARGVSIRDTEGKPYRMAGSHIDITELKQTQDALVQSERQLRTVLDALPLGVWFADRSGKMLLANPAAKQIWSNIKQIGLQTENPQAGWWEAIGPANEPHRWALSHVLTTGGPSQSETFDFECLDGTKKTIRNSTVPVNNEEGVILGAIVLNEDVTMLRQAQEALQLTQFSVDHAVEGFFWIGPDARIFDVNDAACRMLEYTHEELTTMTVHDIDPNLSSEIWPAHWSELKEKGSLTFESKYWSRTGRVLDAEVTVNYLQYEGREYNCAIMRDIGERKRAEVSLRQSEERYRSLVDNAPIGIFLNEAGRFVYANREMLRILKATNAEQLMGTPVLDRVAPEFHTAAKDRIRMLTMGQSILSLDEKFVRLDGSQIDVAVSEIPTSLGGNLVAQVLALDITERKQSAEREAFHNRQLKKLYELSMTLSGDPGVVFEHVVRIIGELFKVQVVCLSEIVGQELYFKSVYINGQIVTNAGHCSLAITPCATVEQTKDLRIFSRVMERFPQASFLRDHQAVSYCGFPALDNEGRVVAVTCLLDNKPHDFSKEEQDLLRIFGQRIATEIERGRHTAEQKRVEKELRESHAFTRQIIDTHPNFIFVKDREGRFTLVNKAFADVHGTTVENLIGKTDADFNPNQEAVASFCQQDLAVMDTLHELFLPEEVITGVDGRTLWLQTVKRPILDDAGCGIMVLGSSTDITERKRIEETLRQRERDLRAAIEERERISQDLHDGILQSLFAVGLTLEAGKSMLSPTARKTSGPSLDQAIEQLNQVMREIRNFIAGLGTDLLQGKDLPTALKRMLTLLTQSQATRVRLAVEERAAKALSTEQSLHLIRVVQEAVSNCIKHGRAQEAKVSLKMLKQGIRLSVRDNGRGFNLTATNETGYGLRNMASRAQKIGGRFTVLSKKNEGTSIVLDLPNEANDASR